MDVLRKEEEHRQLHKRGECHCEVIFDSEERERRLRPRGGKGKGKVKEGARLEYTGQAGGEEGAENQPVAEDAAGTRQDVVEAGPSCPSQGWGPEPQMAAYHYVRYHGGGGQGRVDLAEQEQRGEIQVDLGDSRIDLVPLAQGYSTGVRDRMHMDQVAAGQGFPVGGFVPLDYLWEGQMDIGQPGAGMKWYPQQHEHNMPAMPDLYPPASTRVFDKMPRERQRAETEPQETTTYTTPSSITSKEPVNATEPQQPAIVSSDMAL